MKKSRMIPFHIAGHIYPQKRMQLGVLDLGCYFDSKGILNRCKQQPLQATTQLECFFRHEQLLFGPVKAQLFMLQAALITGTSKPQTVVLGFAGWLSREIIRRVSVQLTQQHLCHSRDIVIVVLGTSFVHMPQISNLQNAVLTTCAWPTLNHNLITLSSMYEHHTHTHCKNKTQFHCYLGCKI